MQSSNKTKSKLIILLLIVFAGILSRIVKTNFVIFDKYLGDALYAAMFFVIIDLAFTKSVAKNFLMTLTLMIAIECFQLTLIPQQMIESGNLINKVIGALLGAEFNLIDIFAYIVGISTISLLYSKLRH